MKFNSHFALGIVAMITLMSTLVIGAEEETQAHQRQHEVAQRGAAIMPFDLSRTTHVFDDQADGGLQTVTANDLSDTAQIYLIRDHLAELANRFARGNFADQAWLHGLDMPGLAELSADYKKLKITYYVLPNGASLKLASDDPAMVTAIHKYFSAQRSDHAAHGEMMHHH
ncbi:MAG: aspartate carbamoyltransferase [Deltaproteobacteria bacterium]|nr:aspartate carbamoyltransferase [Deltaproteobacteria bacterium]